MKNTIDYFPHFVGIVIFSSLAICAYLDYENYIWLKKHPCVSSHEVQTEQQVCVQEAVLMATIARLTKNMKK